MADGVISFARNSGTGRRGDASLCSARPNTTYKGEGQRQLLPISDESNLGFAVPECEKCPAQARNAGGVGWTAVIRILALGGRSNA
jgi:hypothetical protein